MLDPTHVKRIVERPRLLSGVGQLFGLGQAEQQALVQGGMPTWAWIGLALGVGLVAGAYAEKRWRVI